MSDTPLHWIDIAGARDPLADGKSVLERASLTFDSTDGRRYRTEASLAEWLAVAPISELAAESARIARLSIRNAVKAADIAADALGKADPEAVWAFNRASVVGLHAREASARLAVARYVAAIGSIRYAQDAGHAASGIDMPEEIAAASGAVAAAAEIAADLAIAMRIASAAERADGGIGVADAPAVRQLLDGLGEERAGEPHIRALIARIEAAAASADAERQESGPGGP